MVAIGWVDLDSMEIETLWGQAAQLDQDDLELYLQSSYEACEPYAPAPKQDADGQPIIPHSWRLAQIMHAKHLAARFRTGNKDSIGPDGYTISTYPLVLEARSLLRPKRPAFKGLR